MAVLNNGVTHSGQQYGLVSSSTLKRLSSIIVPVQSTPQTPNPTPTSHESWSIS